MFVRPAHLTGIARRTAIATCLTTMAIAQTFLGDSMNNQRNTADPSIAVGASHIVQTTNSRISIYDRNSGSRGLSDNLNSPGLSPGQLGFFGPLGGTRIVDTKVVFDRDRQRFAIVGLQIDRGPITGTPGIYVAYSKTQNLSGSGAVGNDWWRYVTPQPRYGSPLAGWIVNPTLQINGQYRADYNGLAVIGDQLVYAANLEPISPTNGPNVQFYRLFEIAPFLTGAAPVYQDVFVFGRGTAEFAYPCDDLDGTEYAAIFASVRDPISANGYFIELNQVGAVVPSRLVTVNGFTLPSSAGSGTPQGNQPAFPNYPNPMIDSGDGRVRQAVYRAGHVFLCHTVMIPAPPVPGRMKHVVRWYDVDLKGWPSNYAQPVLAQSGDIDLGNEVSGQPIHTYVGGISVNADGVIGVTYTRSSADRRPEAAMSLHRPCMALNTTLDDPLTQPIYNSPFPFSGSGSSPERWGDWATVAIGAFNPLEFYVSSEVSIYSAATGPQFVPQWGTVIHRRNGASGSPTPGTTLQYGTGYPLFTRQLTFSAATPRIGAAADLVFQHGLGSLNGQGALLWIGLGQDLLGTPTGFGGNYYINLAQPNTSVFFLLNQAPAIDTHYRLDLPTDPVFVGQQLYYQMFATDPSNTVVSTNGLGLTLGC